MLPLIQTANVKLILSILSVWLQQDKLEPFVLVGPSGCGKRYGLKLSCSFPVRFLMQMTSKLFACFGFSVILNECFRNLRGIEVAIIHCSAQITPQHVLQRLNQVPSCCQYGDIEIAVNIEISSDVYRLVMLVG